VGAGGKSAAGGEQERVLLVSAETAMLAKAEAAGFRRRFDPGFQLAAGHNPLTGLSQGELPKVLIFCNSRRAPLAFQPGG
jgi:hypothetical protein